jgi:glycosyltransferase 2 family protein
MGPHRLPDGARSAPPGLETDPSRSGHDARGEGPRLAGMGVALHPAPAHTRVTLQRVVRRRTVSDALRAAGFVLLVLVGVLLATAADQTMAGVERDVVALFSVIPASLRVLVVTATTTATLLLALIALIAVVVTRRWRTLIAGAAVVAVTGVAFGALLSVLPIRVPVVPDTAVPIDEGVPTSAGLAMLTGLAVLAAAELPRRWRGAVWSLVGVVAVLRVLSAQGLALDVVLAVGVGGALGSLLLLVIGHPVRMASVDGIRVALERAGLDVHSVQVLPHAGSGPWAYRVDADGRVLLVTVYGPEDQQLDSLYRAYRRVRLRDVGDDAPYASARRAVAVQALVSDFVAQRGVRTPAVRAIAPVGQDEIALAVDHVSGRALDQVPDSDLTDEVLHDCWAELAALRHARVAHRGLNLRNLRLSDEGAVWVLGFGFAQPGAEDAVLSGDVAELLAATYARVGAERAVAAARDVIGDSALSKAMVRLVPVALTPETRSAVQATHQGVEPLVTEVCRVTGVERSKPAAVERISPRYLLIGLLLAAAVYILLPQLADVPRMVETVRGADWRWLPAVLATSVLTYVGSGLGLAGATPGRVPPAQAAAVALASSFVATVTPPGVGHVALNLRYLQKRGLPAAVAVSASTAKEATVVLAHVVLLVVFSVWVGRTGVLADELEQLPPVGVLLAVAGGVLAGVGLALLVPRVRAWLRTSVAPAVRASVSAMGQVLRIPGKVAMLVGGVTLLPLGYAACLYASTQAFGGGAAFGAVAVVYLTAGTLASAAPTPGGLGAVEAVLLAALAGIGIPAPQALASVFLFRLATFWLPIVPGFVALRVLASRDLL